MIHMKCIMAELMSRHIVHLAYITSIVIWKISLMDIMI